MNRDGVDADRSNELVYGHRTETLTGFGIDENVGISYNNIIVVSDGVLRITFKVLLFAVVVYLIIKTV